MKKLRVVCIALAIALVACMCSMMTACKTDYTGSYKFESLTMNQGGVSVEMKVGEKFMGSITITEDFMTCEINDDGTFTMSINAGEVETITGTWAEDGKDSIILTVEGEDQTCSCDGDTLVFEDDDMGKIVFKKA